MRKRWVFILVGSILILAVLLAAWPVVNKGSEVDASVNVFASPVQAGCYLSGPSECRIHVEPFTINIASGKKLALFQLIAIQNGTGTQTVIHDFRPDQSNPVPALGITYTPSLVALDYAAACGKSYEISLQGRDTGDTSTYNLGLTGLFTCPTGSLP